MIWYEDVRKYVAEIGEDGFKDFDKEKPNIGDYIFAKSAHMSSVMQYEGKEEFDCSALPVKEKIEKWVCINHLQTDKWKY